MTNYTTFHKVLDVLEGFVTSSPIMKTYGYGNLVDFGKNVSGTTVQYPFMFVVPQGVQYDENTTTYSLSIIFADILHSDLSNEKDCVSDMSLEARRLLSYIKRGQYTAPLIYDTFDIALPSTAVPFMERMADHVAGVALQVNLQVFEDINACEYYDVTLTPTPTSSVTPTVTPTNTTTPTNTPTQTITQTPTTTQTPTLTPSPTTPVPVSEFWVAIGLGTNSLGYSLDGITWSASTNGNSILTDNAFNGGVVYNGSRWVAVGGGTVNSIAYSNDGITWSGSTNGYGLSEIGWSVAWNGSLFVAGMNTNQGNLFVYSSDGITWNGAGVPLGNGNAFCIASDGTGFVAGGNFPSRLGYSNDGITWSASTNASVVFDTATAVGYDGVIWVAGGGVTINSLGYSTDGITWSASTNGNSIFTSEVNGLAWNGSIWVAGGAGTNSLGYSTDGITWSASTNGNSVINSVRSVAWNGSLFVAAGNLGGGATQRLAYSTDGITWSGSTNGNSIFTNRVWGVASKPAPELYPPR